MEPVEDAGSLAPEILRLLDRPPVHLLVLREALDVGTLGDLGLDGDHGSRSSGKVEDGNSSAVRNSIPGSRLGWKGETVD